MFHPIEDFHKYIQPGKRVHLAGIGGVSMCALAEVLQGMGVTVQGSDMSDSATVQHLRSVGIPVAVGHSAENLKNCDAVIRTAAIHDNNPEIAGAVARGIPVYERAQAWGAIMQGYRNALCVSGTHGKTTTTSMATHIFMAAQADPTVMIGGTLPLLHSGYRVGKGDTIILESCEYCNSFLNFFPTVAVILNVHADHLDFFKDLADIEHSFHDFAALVPQRGYVISNADDQGAREAVAGLSHPVFTFSLADRTADCYARDVAFFDGFGCFDAPEFANFRMVCDDPEKADQIMAENGYMTRITQAILVDLQDEIGGLDKLLSVMGDSNVNLHYIYTFFHRGLKVPVAIMHCEDLLVAESVLRNNGFKVLNRLVDPDGEAEA